MPKSSKIAGLTKEDFEDKKFKVAPSGRYTAKISKGSAKGTSIKAGSNGDYLNVHATITNGKSKGVTFFDAVGASVGWKIAQLLKACGLDFAKASKKIKTLQDLLTLIAGTELDVVLRKTKYNGNDKNEVVQWLPLGAAADEDEESEEDEDADDEDTEDADDESDEEDEDDEEESEDDEDESDDDDDADDDESDDEDEEESEDEDESDDDDDEEEDEADEEEDEDDEPVKKPAKKKAAPAKKNARRKK